MQAITNRSGGVEAKFLLALQKLFQRETNLERRLILMQMLKLSPPGTLKEAVQSQKIILELQKWLQSAAESKEFRLAFRVIETLDRLPITLEALKVVVSWCMDHVNVARCHCVLQTDNQKACVSWPHPSMGTRRFSVRWKRVDPESALPALTEQVQDELQSSAQREVVSRLIAGMN